MIDTRTAVLDYARQNREQFLSELKEILSIPSVSTDPRHVEDIQRAAQWVAAQLSRLGMDKVQIFPTSKHPIVYAERLEVKEAPTILLYSHYDVQPADPIGAWESDPFRPTIRGDYIFARGASDMKGQMLAALKAVESLLKTGGLPVNIKWLIEGEEEIGSPSLSEFIASHRELLACDSAVNPDAGLLGKDYPTITYALRGLAYFELWVYGPAHDLHSGIYGGAIRNPANALAELIAGMHDAKGRVTLPGFYDKVRPLRKQERLELKRLPVDEKTILEQTGAPALYGEAGYSANERMGARPTLDVNGLLSGFTGEGSKTIIPAWAMAKISMRLVPDQDPEEVYMQLNRYLETHAPRGVRWEVKKLAGNPPSISSRDNAAVRAMSQALETVWGTHPYFKREGGSIPVVVEMQRLLGVESVVAGFGLPDDNVHAPNERLHLPTWERGIQAFIHFFLNLAN